MDFVPHNSEGDLLGLFFSSELFALSCLTLLLGCFSIASVFVRRAFFLG